MTDNTLQGKDKLRKQVVNVLDFAGVGRGMIWDISEIEETGNPHFVSYWCPSDNESAITGSENHALFHYLQDSTHVYMVGYENNTSKVVYNSPELYLKLPIVYGGEEEKYFYGSGAYSNRLFYRIYGKTRLFVDGLGCLVLPGGDSLQSVKRVHTSRIFVEHYIPDIHSENDLQVYTDSIAPFTPDSVDNNIDADFSRVRMENYRYYADGYRYPIYEVDKMYASDGTVLKSTAYYLPPSEQELIDDADNEYHRLRMTVKRNVKGKESYNKDTNSFIYNKVKKTDDGKWAMELFLPYVANVSVELYTLDGIMLFYKKDAYMSEGMHEWLLDSDKLSAQNVVILNVTINGTSSTEKVVIKQ